MLVFDSPAVVVVHVEDQVRGDLVLDDPRQQDARQEAFASAAFAEHAHRALDQPPQVEVDLRLFQFQRRADVEVRRVFAPEDVVHVLGGRDLDRHEVAGDGLHRAWLALVLVDGQHRRNVDRPEGRCARVDFAQERVRQVRRIAADGGVGRVERNVGDHAEKALATAAHDDVTPHGEVLDHRLAVELDIQPSAQRSPDHHAEALSGHHQAASGVEHIPREPVVEPVRIGEQSIAKRHGSLPLRIRTLVLKNYTSNPPVGELRLYCTGPDPGLQPNSESSRLRSQLTV